MVIAIKRTCCLVGNSGSAPSRHKTSVHALFLSSMFSSASSYLHLLFDLRHDSEGQLKVLDAWQMHS